MFHQVAEPLEFEDFAADLETGLDGGNVSTSEGHNSFRIPKP